MLSLKTKEINRLHSNSLSNRAWIRVNLRLKSFSLLDKQIDRFGGGGSLLRFKRKSKN